MRVECFLPWFLLCAAETSRSLMAENDQRSYRDPLRRRGAEEEPRAPADDPLAQLARLIGQSVPMNKLSRDRRPAAPQSADDRRGEAGHAAPSPEPAARENPTPPSR